MNQAQLIDHLPTLLGDALLSERVEFGELTCEIACKDITTVCQKLRDDKNAQFDQLIDLCGVDYSSYGEVEDAPTGNGTQRNGTQNATSWPGSRYAVVYHLLSLNHNFRLRLRAELGNDPPTAESVIDIWPAANWFEREAFDLLGIIFTGHPDLRRLLTDYGFIGHPMRKDFPLSGQVEVRYDEQQGRVIYQPVTIDERILVPRTIRKDAFVKTARKGVAGDGGGLTTYDGDDDDGER